MTIQEDIAEHVCKASFDDLPDEVTYKVKHSILDSLGCAIGGTRTEIGRVLLSSIKRLLSKGPSTVLGIAEPSHCLIATFLNSELANVLDFDDCSPRSGVGHPGATVVPPALAVGEMQHATGKEIINAVALGYEVCIRIGLAIRPSDKSSKIIYGHAPWQTFGAVTAASKLLHLDSKETAMALGVAGAAAPLPSDLKCSQNPSNLKFGMSMSKNNFGFAAQVGVLASLMAGSGYTGPLDLFEGETGFWRFAGSDHCNFDQITRGLGDEYLIRQTSFKPYSCCRVNLPVIDACKRIIQAIGCRTADIDHIVVRTYSSLCESPKDDVAPRTQGSAIYSIPFSVAASILDITPGPDWFTSGCLADPQVLELSRKVKLVGDPEADERKNELGRLYAKVTIRSHTREVSEVIRGAKGEPETPMSEQELRDKFASLSRPLMSCRNIDRTMGLIGELETLADVNKLTKLLRFEAAQSQPKER